MQGSKAGGCANAPFYHLCGFGQANGCVAIGARRALCHQGLGYVLDAAHAVEHIRLEKACRLIEAHRHSNKAVAVQCGFNSEEVMRHVFMRHLNVSPKGYRERCAAADA